MSKRKIFDKVMEKQIAQDEKEQAAIKEEAKKDLQRYSAIAKKVLRIVIDADLEIGEIDVTKGRPEAYASVARQVMELFLEEDIRFIDKEFPFMLAKQPLALIEKIVTVDLEKSFKLAQAAAMGCDEMDEVTMGTVDRVWREYDAKKKGVNIASEPQPIGEQAI